MATPKQKREARVQQLIQLRLASKYERRLAAEIERAMRASTKGADWFMEHVQRVGSIMRSLWHEAGMAGAERILDAGKSAGMVTEQKDADPTLIMDTVMRNWLAHYGTEKITQVAQTTRNQITRAIDRGIEEGLTEREITRSIQQAAPGIAGSRAQTIARTEVHTASSAASDMAAEATGIAFIKVWLAANDDRAREDHTDADGQEREMYDAFDIGGEQMMYPGDDSLGAGAGNIVNCRCVVMYQPKGF